MRPASLLSLAFTAALGTACRSEVATQVERQETAARTTAAPDRDLTLRAPTPAAVEVASPVELSRARPAPAPAPAPRPRPKAKPTSSPEPQPAPQTLPVTEAEPEVVLVPGPAHAASERLAEPAPAEVPGGAGRELAPGKTVTVIPVSSGPTVEADEDDSWLPSERPRGIIGRGGGTCRPRGGVRGIGITGRIPVGVPGRRLR